MILLNHAQIAEIDITQIPDDYQSLCDVGRVIASSNDRNRWVLGRLGLRVVKAYGEDIFGDFANDIGMIAKTLYGYREVVEFYGENSPHEENLHWSHYRSAKRLGDLPAALCALQKASSRNRTATYFDKIITRFLGVKKKKARKLVDTEATVTAIDTTGGVSLHMDAALTPKLHAGTRYRTVFYEVIEEE